MKIEKDTIIKLLIFVLIILIVIIIAVIMFLNSKTNKLEQNNNYNININNLNDTEENESFANEENEINNINVNYVTNNTVLQNSVNSNLEEDYDSQEYFLIKQLMKKYYDTYDVVRENIEGALDIEKQDVLNLIDDEVIKNLNIDLNNFSSLFGNISMARYNIDELYKKEIDVQKNLYLVYYRIQVETGIEKQAMFVKVDNKNKTFSIYPYQYLKEKNYLDLSGGDDVNIENTANINKTSSNMFKMDSSDLEAIDYLKELFERYKFDLEFDTRNLYDMIDKKYKNIHYDTFEKFNEFIEQNKDILLNDELESYGTASGDEYSEFIGRGESEREYIFDAKNLMNYSIMLDSYTIETLKYQMAYNASLYQVRGQFCIDRIMKAINEKNYKFVYEKLNFAQKNNYYRNYEDFEKFILENFYEKNEYNVPEKAKTISTSVYQYKIEVTNSINKSENNVLNMTVYLKENGEFEVSILK